MGDNIFLGDRNGVRTPMQWSADRNAGFSRANPARLYSPVIMDPVFGYEVVNVEAQESDASSLLNWTRHMIALRKLFRVFGRGTIEFLEPANRKILAYLRQYDGERVLCVANLSRFAQPVELDLAALAGTMPVEMLGYVEFPRIGRTPYPLTLAPYGFLWFELHGKPEPVEVAADALEPSLVLPAAMTWDAPFQPGGHVLLDACRLPVFLQRQRWFGGKSRAIARCAAADWIPLTDSSGIAVVEVEYADGGSESYVLTLAHAVGDAADHVRASHAAAVVCAVTRGDESGVIHEALTSDDRCRDLLTLILDADSRRGLNGTLAGEPRAEARQEPPPPDGWTIGRTSGEQSNSSIIFGDRFIMKLFRRLEFGPNADSEMTRYLSEVRGFEGVPPYAGRIAYHRPVAGDATLGFLQRLVEHQGDGWQWMLDELGRYYERALTSPMESLLSFADHGSLLQLAEREFPPGLDEWLGFSDDAAAVLGRRTAEMHLALAHPTDDAAFAPEPLLAADIGAVVTQLRDHTSLAFNRLRDLLPALPDDVTELASLALSMRSRVLQRVEALADITPAGARIRVHGDYHLGQVLRVGTDFVIIDFEGEPTRPLAARREKQCALKDVAGMLRSFSYAARYALMTHVVRRSGGEERLRPWARLWERSVHAAFLREYRRTAAGASFLPGDADTLARVLELYLLDKLVYELRYELDNRPTWVSVPLAGLVDFDTDERQVDRRRGSTGA